MRAVRSRPPPRNINRIKSESSKRYIDSCSFLLCTFYRYIARVSSIYNTCIILNGKIDNCQELSQSCTYI